MGDGSPSWASAVIRFGGEPVGSGSTGKLIVPPRLHTDRADTQHGGSRT